MRPFWSKKEDTKDKLAIDYAVEELESAREKRKSLLRQIMLKIDRIPIDDRLIDLGKDLRGQD